MKKLAFAVAAALALNIGLNLAISFAAEPPWNRTVFWYLGRFVHARMGEDSWAPMRGALAHLRSGEGRPLYDEMFFIRRTRFQYPPSALLALEALPADEGLNVASTLGVVVAALVTGVLLSSGRPRREGAALLLLGACGALLFYPILKAYSLGQIQTWITALLALLLLAWIEGRKALAGVLLGLVCLIKPHLGMLGLWALLRREHRFLLAAVLTVGAGLAASVARYGFVHHLNYLDVLAFLGRHGESFYANQSMNGLLHRLRFNGGGLPWTDTFPPYDPVVFAGTLIATLAILGLALSPPRLRSGSVLDLATMLLASTMASPIAWDHHYGILAPILALLAVESTNHRFAGRWTAPLIALSHLLSANYIAAAQLLIPTSANPLQSHLYFGALIAWVLLLLARRARRQVPTLVTESR